MNCKVLHLQPSKNLSTQTYLISFFSFFSIISIFTNITLISFSSLCSVISWYSTSTLQIIKNDVCFFTNQHHFIKNTNLCSWFSDATSWTCITDNTLKIVVNGQLNSSLPIKLIDVTFTILHMAKESEILLKNVINPNRFRVKALP